ncbi:MAG: hypothetical protein AAGD25_20140 [Cyanobacteria bacterium P01_F01_bin.150]
MEIVFKSDDNLVLKFVQDRWISSIYAFVAFAIFGLLEWTDGFQDDLSFRNGQLPLIIIVALLGVWVLINPSFNFHGSFGLKDEMILISIIVFYMLTSPSPFQNIMIVEFDKQQRTIIFMKKGWIKRNKTVYRLEDFQGVRYREEKRESYTLYGLELTIAEKTIYFSKRTYKPEIPKDKYMKISAEISNFIT